LSLRDEGLLVGHAAALLGGLLLEAGDVHDAVDLLMPLARSHPDVFTGWAVLATALRRSGPNWAELLAEVAAPVPAVVEPLLSALGDDERRTLIDALRVRSVDEWQLSEDDRVWRAMQPELRRMSRSGIVAAARQHEVSAPALAFRLWSYAGDDATCRVGQARCLDALGRIEEAAEILAGVEPAGLDAPDVVFVAALAADLGQVHLAVALLDGLPEDLASELAEPAKRLRTALAEAVD
jgi:hypothetical protein